MSVQPQGPEEPEEPRRLLGLSRRRLVLIGVLLALVVLLGAVTTVRTVTEQASAQRLAAAYTPPPLPTPDPVVTFDQAVARIEDPERPFTIAVVGDSTGYGPERWVGQFATLLAQERDRQVLVHDWDDEGAEYRPPRAVGIGGTPITVWNASAPGQGPGYSKDNLQAMIPDGVRPDVVIVNHGHNTGPDVAVDMAELMSALQFQYPDAPVAYTVQNPFRGDSPAEYEARAADELAYGEQHGWRIDDVYDAFTSQPDLAALYVDDRHENARGGVLWARTVLEATGL